MQFNEQIPNQNANLTNNQIQSENPQLGSGQEQSPNLGIRSLRTNLGTSNSAPIQSTHQQSAHQQSISPSINLDQIGTLKQVLEALEYIKQKEMLSQQPQIGTSSTQVPTLNTTTSQPQPTQAPPLVQQPMNLPQESILVPQLTLDEYKGKTHIFEFLQYLYRQKSVLSNTRIPKIQKKCLLNNKLPPYISNNMVQVVNDSKITLDEYIQQVQEYYGPRKEQVRQQLMSQNLGKYDNYISFIHKLQQYSQFANISDENLLFILEQKLPKHVTGLICQCKQISEYIYKLKILFKEGWFPMAEDQFRRSMPSYQKGDKRGENSKDSSKENDNQNTALQANVTSSENSTQQNTMVSNNVAFVDFMDMYDSFPVETRGVKRQHIDTKVNEKFQNQAQNDNQQFQQQLRQQRNQQQTQQNQQQQYQSSQQQQKQQNQSDQQGTSQQNTSQGQNQAESIQDDSLKKLLERAKANVQQNLQQKLYPDIQNISKGVRSKRQIPPVQQVDQDGSKYLQLDPYRYINQNQQTHLTQVFKDVCVPVTLSNYLQLNGFEITKKQDQIIKPNIAYFGEVDNYETLSKFTTTQDLAKTETTIPPQDFENENQMYKYFYNHLLQEQKQNDKSDVIKNTFQNVAQNSESHQQMCVILKINSKPFVGVIDGGASKTILSKQIVEQAGILDQVVEIPQTGRGIFVSGVSGTERIFGIIPRLQVSLQGFDVDFANVLVQSSTNFDMLIGLDVLGLFDFQVGMKNREVSFIPYPDDSRVLLQLCSKQGQTQNIYRTYVSYVSFRQNLDFGQYMREVETIYPEFSNSKTYELIYTDPPWLFEKAMYKTKPQYPCLNEKQLQLLPIQTISAQNCILLIWSTGSHMPQAIRLLKFWGFKFINFFLVWKKINKINKQAVYGHGYYSKNCFEVLLIATKGKVANLRRDQRYNVSQELQDTVEIQEPRSDFFSRKPLSVYKYIQQVFKVESLRCLEIFATQRNKYNSIYDLYGNTLQPRFQKQIIFEEQVDVAYQTFSNTLQIKNNFKNYEFNQSEKIKQYCNNLNIPIEVDKKVLQTLKNLITKYSTVFKFDNKLTYTNLGEADIEIKPFSKPVSMKPYQIIGEPYEFLKNKFDELEQQGLVTKGKSNWATPVMVVPKDNPKEKYRAVQNFKRINQLTIKDKYPLRLINHIIIKLNNKSFYCVLDLKGGFNQVKRSLRSKDILAMILPFGLYLPEVMFFGETNAPSIFQRYMDMAIGDLYGKGVECYIDDVIVCGNSVEEVLQLLEQLFIRLKKSNFKLNPEKCQYFVQKATILGHEIFQNNLSPKQQKVDKLLQMNPPKSKKQLQQYMGSINYYRKFLPELSTLFLPFQQSLASNSKVLLWQSEQRKSFEIIQSFLKSKLTLKVADLTKTFKVILSHSENTYATALLQNDEQGEYVVSFHSQVQIITKNKQNPYIKEIDCLVWALNEWRCYIQHQTFIVETDQSALKFLYESKTHNLQLINYQLELQDLIFEICPIKNNRLKQMLLLTYLKQDPQLLEQTLENITALRTNQTYSDKVQKQQNNGTAFENFEYIMRFDGASIKLPFNTQMGAGAYAIFNNKNKILFQDSFEFLGAQTNNCAEYQALIMGLQFLKNQRLNKKFLLIQGDSQLVIKQINYQYMCNSENLATLCTQARDLLKQFPQVKIEHIDRKYNVDCDKLAKTKLAKLSQKFQLQNLTYEQNFVDLSAELDIIKCKVCKQEEPTETMLLCDHCNNGYHIDCIGLQDIPSSDWYCDTCLQDILDRLQTNTYIDPIEDFTLLNFLKGNINLDLYDNVIKNRVLQRAKIYTLINEKLYKISQNNLREVPTVGERTILVEQIHQLVGHLGQNRTFELIQQYYYWPNMQFLIENTLRHCLLCQAQNPKYLRMPGAFPLSKNFKPMQVLYLDCFYLPQSRKGNKLVVLSICGTSKWVEGKAIPTNNSKYIRDFIFDQIICRYGSPQVIRSDNGPEFRGEVSSLCERLGIIQIFSSPYYPQTNGQVERMNRTVKNCMIKLSNCYIENEFDWEDLLPQTLMGVNFTKSRPTKYSAFQTLFGTDPILPGYQAIQKTLTLTFPNEYEQENYLFEKIKYKQNILSEIRQNLTEMESEIEDVILKREKISNTELDFGHLVFLKREDAKYPQTKSKGPFIFLGYNDQQKTSAMLISPKNQKIVSVNVTKINPIKLY